MVKGTERGGLEWLKSQSTERIHVEEVSPIRGD